MIPLNGQQKQLLFDYSMGLTSPQDSAEAERLLATHDEASEVYHALKSVLDPLDSYEVGPCPDELADVTISRLKAAAMTEPASAKIETLLATEDVTGPTVVRVPLWRNWGDVAAVAAVIVLLVGVVLPALGMARQKYWQMRCESNLSDVHEGFTSYVADHDGKLPNSVLKPGSPWWKVGYQQENVSNTRGAWLMVKNGYVTPEAFTCAGRRESRTTRIDAADIASYNDFPNRSSMHYSTRVCCPNSDHLAANSRTVIYADRNPISEKFPSDYSKTYIGLRLCEELLTANSRNHSGRGQNALFSDGSVEFTRQRYTKSSKDDIYTLAEMSDGYEVRGVEVPSCEKDAFLVP